MTDEQINQLRADAAQMLSFHPDEVRGYARMLGQPVITDVVNLGRAIAAGATQAIIQIEQLQAECEKLRAALEHYQLATVVSRWAYQELAPNWEIARTALGLPKPTPLEQHIALGEPPPDTLGSPYRTPPPLPDPLDMMT